MACGECIHYDPTGDGKGGECTYDVSDITLPASVGLPMPIKKNHVTARGGRNCQCFEQCKQIAIAKRGLAKLNKNERKVLGLT